MKLSHAIRVVEKLANEAKPPMRLAVPDGSRQPPMTRDLGAEEVVALTVLVRFAKRVMAAKDSLRVLHRAVSGEDDLNQVELGLDGELGSGPGGER